MFVAAPRSAASISRKASSSAPDRSGLRAAPRPASRRSRAPLARTLAKRELALPVGAKPWTVQAILPAVDPTTRTLKARLELANPGDSAQVLDGYSLSDEPALPRKFLFPDGATIPAHGTLLVLAAICGMAILAATAIQILIAH